MPDTDGGRNEEEMLARPLLRAAVGDDFHVVAASKTMISVLL